MKTMAFFCLFFLFIAASYAAPDPPPRMSAITSMTISYDLKTSTLHIEAVHPSSNWEIDYIRMITVTVNGNAVYTNNYYHQNNAEGFLEDVPVQAKVGDAVTVQLYCTGGSSMSQDLTVGSPAS